MKKTFCLLMAAAMILTLAACGGTPASGTPAGGDTTSGTAPEEGAFVPVTPGVLTVGTSADFAPYEFHILENGQDKIVGFDMDLAQFIADELGLTLKIIDMSFDSILIELNLGTIDLAIAGLSPDPERQVLFSQPYYTGTQCLMVKKENMSLYTALEDFNDPGLSVGAQSGSIQADLAAEHSPAANQVLLAATPNIMMELKAGTIDAAYMETVVAENYMKTQSDLDIFCEVPYDAEGSCVAVKPGNTELLGLVDAAIDKLLAQGLMGDWVAAANDLSGEAIG